MINEKTDTFIQLEKADQGVKRFKHHAMATIFEILIVHDNPNYAEQSAYAAFQELDRLELELSRFIENSDVSRINQLKSGESIIVGPDTFSCLKACAELYRDTNGYFDITRGLIFDFWKKKISQLPTDMDEVKEPSFPWLKIDENTFSVEKVKSGISLDLGGFGKGYAIDKMWDILREWDIKNYLLHGGGSTLFARSEADYLKWTVSIGIDSSNYKLLDLNNFALSGSGLNKGPHIINPKTGQPVSGRKAAWAKAESAAVSDALSTAFMLMSENEIQKFIQTHQNSGGIICETNSEMKMFGEWVFSSSVT